MLHQRFAPTVDSQGPSGSGSRSSPPKKQPEPALAAKSRLQSSGLLSAALQASLAKIAGGYLESCKIRAQLSHLMPPSSSPLSYLEILIAMSPQFFRNLIIQGADILQAKVASFVPAGFRKQFESYAPGSSWLSLAMVYPLDYLTTSIMLNASRSVQDHLVYTPTGPLHFLHQPGSLLSTLGIMLYRGTYFTLYDALMAKIDVPQVASSVEASKLPKASSGKAVKTFLVGLGVTMFAGLVVYPLDTIRRHQMLTGDTLDTAVTAIYSASGVGGFWGGVQYNIARSLLSSTALLLCDQLVGTSVPVSVPVKTAVAEQASGASREIIEHVLPPLPYALDALEPLVSRECLEFHYGKHHRAYVSNLNGLLQHAPECDGKSLQELVQMSHGAIYNNAAQAWNHAFFWNCMKPNGGGVPDGALAAAINAKWGSYDAFKESFVKSAVGNFGSGWTFLVKKADGTVDLCNLGPAGTPLTSSDKALLTIDVWEHAYYIDYRNQRNKWAEVFINQLVNWDFAAANFA